MVREYATKAGIDKLSPHDLRRTCARLADWACDFFGLLDCEVPLILIGTATPDRDGRFEVRLPDFAADSTSSRPGGAEFDFMLRELRTGNLIAWRWPESPLLRSLGGLKQASSYPRPTVFDVRKPARSL